MKKHDHEYIMLYLCDTIISCFSIVFLRINRLYDKGKNFNGIFRSNASETDMTIEKLTETFPLGEPLRSAFEFPRHPFNSKLPVPLAPPALSA